MATDDKYDRQIRLWGGHGQRLLSTSSVLLLGANPSGTETLKNLILPAVGRFTIVDGEVVTERDCGNNFFVTADSIGKSRAQVVTELLKELNPDVKGDHRAQSIEEFVTKDIELMKSYDLIIATDVDNVENDISLIIIRQYGLIGTVRNFKNEMTVVEAKPSDVQIDDLRITNPFPALKEYALSIKFNELDSLQHSHIPFVVILLQILEKWKSNPDKDTFRQMVVSQSQDFSKEINFNEAVSNIFKCFQKSSIRDSVEELLLDPKIIKINEKSSFWLLATALARFRDSHGTLPLSGQVPDMTATTDFYISLQKIYQQKAYEDLKSFTNILHNLMAERGVNKDSILSEDIRMFCQNAQTLEVTKFRSPELELTLPDFDDFRNELYDPDSCAFWYVAVRAVENFRVKSGRYPGVLNGQEEQDFLAVRKERDELMEQIVPDGSVVVEDKYIKEMVRYGDSKMHTVSAFLGGVASQEAIKMLIKQYTPLNHTFIYDGINGKCSVFNV